MQTVLMTAGSLALIILAIGAAIQSARRDRAEKDAMRQKAIERVLGGDSLGSQTRRLKESLRREEEPFG